MEFDFNVTIVGLGLIGGSFAEAIRELKPKNIWAIDIDEESLKYAESIGIIDKGYTNGEVPLKDSDIIIICLYPELTLKFVKENMKNFKSGAIITDAVGIKEKVMQGINSFIRDDLDFIGGHPMAGRETSGVKSASKDIFKDANYIITPTDKNKKENIEIIENLVREIGFTKVVKIDPGKHDEIIAFTSQLPHVIAIAMMNCNYIENVNSFTGGSFNDVTRIAKINPSLWSELMIENKEHIVAQIDLFQNYMTKVKDAIKNSEYNLLDDILTESSKRKEEQSKNV
ncbi:prephenate dehydrogenase TyrA [Gottschalkia acidurici 9a]|uniref:Prephenate dehydrogenase TyrA n=1 Tax=Gottschalkia acidurici (strain ATCC 7906 / DSM 604 / BCRC 14475 / CIP 104303 / KCTC 5404 / NCIMB 10678 / 9a) TaxID=1128398 RepID=K0AZT2_GOTA9|nr:prephenate dehydrogenase [Gottschalkia acidurici]AFS78230.1 prephenate dehydrogenase TyrA [Gottschalkia acidurici 9a]